MTDLRAAAQQALEALEYAQQDRECPSTTRQAITALRAALAEPVQDHFPDVTKMVQEPVAWIHTDPDKPRVQFLEWREDEPGYRGRWIKTALYAVPPQRKPLTDEETERLYITAKTPMAFARAIEAAHGIGSKT